MNGVLGTASWSYCSKTALAFTRRLWDVGKPLHVGKPACRHPALALVPEHATSTRPRCARIRFPQPLPPIRENLESLRLQLRISLLHYHFRHICEWRAWRQDKLHGAWATAQGLKPPHSFHVLPLRWCSAPVRRSLLIFRPPVVAAAKAPTVTRRAAFNAAGRGATSQPGAAGAWEMCLNERAHFIKI